MELPTDDVVLEDGGMSRCWEHCGHQASAGVAPDGTQVRRTLR